MKLNHHFKRIAVMAIASAAVGAKAAEDLFVPTPFEPNTPARAEDVNDNFEGINNEIQAIAEALEEIEEIEAQSLDSYLNSKLLLGRRIAVELNGEIVPKSQFSSVMLVDDDVLEIVHAIGGG